MLRRTLISSCAVAMLALIMAPTAFARTIDTALAEEISERIRNYAYCGVFDDVEGTVHNGIVSLTGRVLTP